MKTILIVDDEPAARYGLRRALEAKYRIAEADSAEGARVALNTEQPDLILLDVVLPGQNLLAPTLALTNCRVPIGYFSQYIVSLSDYTQRETAQREFWKVWRLGNVGEDFLREAGVSYIAVSKQTEGIPARIPTGISKVFENSEFAVFKARRESPSETGPKP